MTIERTLSIIKPDGVERNLVGKILASFEAKNLKIVAITMKHLTLDEAKQFYSVHSKLPFFGELTTFMARSPVVISVLEGKNAVDAHREIMGATNPQNAAPGTIRKEYSKSVGENTVHGSDSLENAKKEISFFFPNLK